MNSIETPTTQQATPAIQRRDQKALSTDGVIKYFFEVWGLKIAKATVYKKHCTQPGIFPGRRSGFGKLIFDPAEVDCYWLTESAREAVRIDGGQ